MSGTVFINGNIYTLDPARPHASAVAVKGDSIVYVGDAPGDAARAAGPDARTIDLGGETLIPGLIESHMHFLHEGQMLSEMDIYWKSKEEIIELVAQEAARREPGEWIIGRGWNHETWDVRVWPSKDELDRVAPLNPVALSRADHHSMWVNSAALRLAGIGPDTPDPHGGEILRTDSGEPSGILVDTGMFAVWNALPVPDDAETRRLYLLAQDELFAFGITSLVNASQTVRNHDILDAACADGDLKIRVYDMLATHADQDQAWLEAGRGPEFGKYGGRLSARAVKIVLDGSLGSRSAWMMQEYADRPGHRGNERFSDEELFAIVMRARENGFQPCLHAIGDAAVRQAVRVLDDVLRARPLTDHRFRIEHFQTVDPADLRRAIALGIVPAMQAIHLASDWKMAQVRLHPATLATAYIWRDVLDAGGIIAGGSDAPMDLVNPYYGIYASVTRKDLNGEPSGGWVPEQRMTREEALKSYTLWAAYAEFAETRRGSIEVGKLADLTLLDRDIMRCPEDDIKDTKALMTVVGGEVVFDRR
ncbi:amidohydrolase [Desulfovibrio sp. OttesenSCG-928-I05]|nr:amidohydrolase [Desulfovibrio sp. OttesenSCG-928-I05]